MTTAILDQVEQLVDQLSPLEQVKLLEYLTPRIARAVVQQPGASVAHTQYQEAWADLFRVGEAIMASDADDGPTLTSAVQSMRH